MPRSALLRLIVTFITASTFVGCAASLSPQLATQQVTGPISNLDVVLITDLDLELQNSNLLKGALTGVTLGKLFREFVPQILVHNGIQGTARLSAAASRSESFQLQLSPVGCDVECDYPNFR